MCRKYESLLYRIANSLGFHMFGFNEREIAQILNVNSLLVKERLGRAAQLIKCDEVIQDKDL